MVTISLQIFFAPELEEGYDENEKEMVEKLRALIIRQVQIISFFSYKNNVW